MFAQPGRRLGQERLYAAYTIEPAVDASLVRAESSVHSIRSAVACKEAIRALTAPEVVLTAPADEPIAAARAQDEVGTAAAPDEIIAASSN